MSLSDFRAKAIAWLRANVPPALLGTRKGAFDGYWGGRNGDPSPDQTVWLEAALSRGWTAPTWPVEYGGGGLTRPQGRELRSAMQELGVPPPLVGFGLAMMGPTLLDYGTEAQKAEYLPAMVKGEIRWCQGYSEPDAGSDLAGLSTRAVRDGDDFVVNGQKVWTSYADSSDWIFCLVRTNPDVKKQAGITFLLIDMATDGVTTRRIQLISGASPFCEVFLADVRVPLSQVVGPIDGGWTIAKALLQYERSMIGDAIAGQLAGAEASLVTLARDHLGPAEGPLDDSAVREAIAGNAMDETAHRLTVARVAQEAAAGRSGAASSILKIAGSELKQRRWSLAARIAGPQALGWEGPGFTDTELTLTREWLRSMANTIEGGTSEIQLNILAKRVLGLPT
jgi:alkylation response protein AidB-like acyl-CoA dehydrogenase